MRIPLEHVAGAARVDRLHHQPARIELQLQEAAAGVAHRDDLANRVADDGRLPAGSVEDLHHVARAVVDHRDRIAIGVHLAGEVIHVVVVVGPLAAFGVRLAHHPAASVVFARGHAAARAHRLGHRIARSGEEALHAHRISDLGVGVVGVELDATVVDALRLGAAIRQRLGQAGHERRVGPSRVVAPGLHATAAVVVNEVEDGAGRMLEPGEAVAIVVAVPGHVPVRVGGRHEIPRSS